MKNICPHFLINEIPKATPQPQCGGCEFWMIDYSTEIHSKKELLKSKLNLGFMNIRVKNSPESFAIRTRFDFTLLKEHDHFNCGLYSKKEKILVPIETCYVIHPDLQRAFDTFKRILSQCNPEINKGSIRLRHSNNVKKWGIWLDLSNLDIKNLLMSKDFLISLSEHFVIEIGQKKKRLDLTSIKNDQLKLTDPKPEFWFQTLEHPLLCSISSFTQPQFETANLITEEVLKWTKEAQPQLIVEYGSGVGQYTIPLLARNHQVIVFENDLSAVDFLKLNASAYKEKLRVNVEIETTSNSLALVNPSRSGLGSFVDKIKSEQFETIIYISCYLESLSKDLNHLLQDYAIQDIFMVDQFKRTPHFETGILLKRIK